MQKENEGVVIIIWYKNRNLILFFLEAIRLIRNFVRKS